MEYSSSQKGTPWCHSHLIQIAYNKYIEIYWTISTYLRQHSNRLQGNRTFHSLTFRPLDVSSPGRFKVLPLGRFATWTFRPLTGRFAAVCFSMCLFFHMCHVARVTVIKLIGWWINVLSLFSSHCTTELYATLLNFVETSTQMTALLMLSKIASIIKRLTLR